MKSAINNRRLLADIFHDVDLATVGPVRGRDVRTQQPKCRPDALAIWNPDSCLKPPIGLAEFILSDEPRRSVVAGDAVGPGKRLLYRFNDQRPAIEMRIGCAARVGFEFVVTPTLPAKIKGPLG